MDLSFFGIINAGAPYSKLLIRLKTYMEKSIMKTINIKQLHQSEDSNLDKGQGNKIHENIDK